MKETAKRTGMSPIGYILSAIGAAVGLGNIWGFPTKMLTYGGTAFLIPYLVAVLTLGFPMMLLEINIGSLWRKTSVDVFPKYLGRKRGSLFGWMQTTLQMMIGTYYGVIIAWIVISIFTPFVSGGYDQNVANNFDQNILGITETTDFFGLGRIQPGVFLIFVLVIFGSVVIVSFGLERGIEKVNKFLVPFLFILIFFFFIYTLTFNGASKGLEKMFGFDPSKLKSGKAWSTAFGQALFTLSLCEAIIILYSANAPKGGDSGRRAITIVAGDTLIALLACSIISSTLGNALERGIVNQEGSKYLFTASGNEASGNALIFKMFPLVFYNISLNQPLLGEFFGVMLYTALLFAAISTLISLQEPMTAALTDKDGISRPVASFLVGSVQLFFGVIFTTQNGSRHLIDITDGLWVSWLLLLSALIEMGIFTFSRQHQKQIYEHHNKFSFFKLGTWFSVLIVFSWIALLGVFSYGVYDLTLGDYYKSSVVNWTWQEWIFSASFFFVPFFYFAVFKGLKAVKTRLPNVLNFFTKKSREQT